MKLIAIIPPPSRGQIDDMAGIMLEIVDVFEAHQRKMVQVYFDGLLQRAFNDFFDLQRLIREFKDIADHVAFQDEQWSRNHPAIRQAHNTVRPGQAHRSVRYSRRMLPSWGHPMQRELMGQ